jgi:hypothetical protein
MPPVLNLTAPTTADVAFTDVMLNRLDAFIEDHDPLSIVERPARG